MNTAFVRWRMPSGTTLRMALLIAMTVASASVLYLLITPPGLTGMLREVERCRAVSGWPDLTAVDLITADRFQGTLDEFSACQAVAFGGRPWSIAAGLMVLFALAALLYRLQPWWRIRRAGLVELRSTAAPELLTELDRMVTSAGLRHRPRFLVDPISQRTGGLAFGRGRRPLICLDAGLVTQFQTNPAMFRAVVTHELAHLRNNDVAITYFAIAIWRAFIVAAVLPYVGVFLLQVREPNVLVTLTLPVTVLAVLVLFARNSILRLREHHADITASRMLASTEPSEFLPGLAGTHRRRLPVPLRKHPTSADRVAVLTNPALVYRPGFGEAVTAGATLQIAVAQVLLTLFYFGVPVGSVMLIGQVLTGTGLAAALGIAVLRARQFRAAGGTARRLVVLPGLGIALGTGIGHNVTVVDTHVPSVGVLATIGAVLLVIPLILLGEWALATSGLLVSLRQRGVRITGAVAVGAVVLLLCVSTLSLATLPRAVPGLVGSFLVLAQPIEQVVGAADWTALDLPLTMGIWLPLTFLSAFVLGGLGKVGLLLLWAVPLILERRRADRRALVAGILGAAVWAVFSLALRASLRADVPMPARDDASFRLVLSVWEVAGVVIAQFAVCVVVSLWLVRSLVRTMFAGAVTGTMCALALWALFVTDACVPVLQAAKTTCPAQVDIAYGTTIFGLLTVSGFAAAIAGYAIASLLRPRKATTALADSRLGYGAAAGVFAVLCLLVVPAPAAKETTEEPLAEAAAAARAEHPDSPAALRFWRDTDGERMIAEVLEPFHQAMVKAAGNSDAGISPDFEAARTGLGTAARAIDKLETEPGPPGKRAHALWIDWLSTVDESIRLIDTAIRTDDTRMLSSGAKEFDRATELIATLRAMSE
ncbi:Zn-dependent protease with chaperone function [Amycolatopsis marina]|uniref:Zn-dependent protease with chaperone function n=1 Tax=Amycolatopsis marina TaxID=490629 RepID=A0A1I0ZUK4_9PSEU|nr:M48 family metalloprotease [Amycolatopsis marina]SFB29241.1 Zn-dependent protease with chaperone function [Amycolatopsis marina]